MHDDIILGLTGIRQLKGGGRGKMTQGFGGIRVRNGATGLHSQYEGKGWV